MEHERIHPDVHVGHIHLRVADLDRAVAFYRDVLGFTVTEYMADEDPPRPFAFLAAGNYHHHIALNSRDSQGGTQAPASFTGMYHVCLLYPNNHELARAIKRLLDSGFQIERALDHGTSVSVYLPDPDGNMLELSYDRPRADWPVSDEGYIRFSNVPFDLNAFVQRVEDQMQEDE